MWVGMSREGGPLWLIRKAVAAAMPLIIMPCHMSDFLFCCPPATVGIRGPV